MGCAKLIEFGKYFHDVYHVFDYYVLDFLEVDYPFVDDFSYIYLCG